MHLGDELGQPRVSDLSLRWSPIAFGFLRGGQHYDHATIDSVLSVPGLDRLVTDLQVVSDVSDATPLKKVQDSASQLGWVSSSFPVVLQGSGHQSPRNPNSSEPRTHQSLQETQSAS